MPTPSARLLALLSLLQARRDWPGSVLADRLEISARTVRRDVDQLRGLGYRIDAIKGPDGGYRLESGSELPPLLFDDEQAVALAIALALAAASGAGIEEAAVRALATVRQVMPARLRRRIDALQVAAVEPPGQDAPPVDAATLTAIGAAIHAGELLRFAYASPAGDGDLELRTVEPHHLVAWQRRWYLVAWDPSRDGWRTFRADRMTVRSPTGVRFTRREVPGGDVSAFVAGRFRGATDATNDWPCRGEVVLARPAADLLPYVRDGVVEAAGPDRCRLTLGSWSWTALAAAIGGFDADVEAARPPELAAAFGVLAHRYARAADASPAD